MPAVAKYEPTFFGKFTVRHTSVSFSFFTNHLLDSLVCAHTRNFCSRSFSTFDIESCRPKGVKKGLSFFKQFFYFCNTQVKVTKCKRALAIYRCHYVRCSAKMKMFTRKVEVLEIPNILISKEFQIQQKCGESCSWQGSSYSRPSQLNEPLQWNFKRTCFILVFTGLRSRYKHKVIFCRFQSFQGSHSGEITFGQIRVVISLVVGGR